MVNHVDIRITPIMILLLCSACGGGNSNSPSDTLSSSEGENSDLASNASSPPLSLNIIAERTARFDITPDFPVRWNYSRISSYPKNLNASLDNGVLSVKSKNRFLGKDSLTIRFRNAETDETIYQTVEFLIEEPGLAGNEDYSISYWCDSTSGLYNLSGTQAVNIDMEFVYDDLTSSDFLYEAHTPAFMPSYIPNLSKVQVEQHGLTDQKSQIHHQNFANNKSNNLLLTCNYQNGSAELFIPIKNNPAWRAIIPGASSNYQYDRNDLIFYISPLSDFRTSIYREEYSKTGDHDAAIIATDSFMESVFPGSYYNPISTSAFGTHPQKESRKRDMFPIIESDNQKYYRKFEYWSETYSNGDTDQLIDYFRNIYSEYVYQDRNCINFGLCAEFFDNFTNPITNNFDFSEGLSNWEVIESYSNTASGNVVLYPATQELEISINVNTEGDINAEHSIVDVYQTHELGNTSIYDYFFEFEVNHVYGGSSGFGAIAGVYSSGWGGTYLCFKNINGIQLGCATWIDHTDKLVIPVYGDNFNITSSDFFYIHKLYPVMRRKPPEQEEVEFTVSVKDILQLHLPALDTIKDQISSIDYGVFVTEARNTEGDCYYCEAKVVAKKLILSQRVENND
jgi:hypothetical protein